MVRSFPSVTERHRGPAAEAPRISSSVLRNSIWVAVVMRLRTNDKARGAGHGLDYFLFRAFFALEEFGRFAITFGFFCQSPIRQAHTALFGFSR